MRHPNTIVLSPGVGLLLDYVIDGRPLAVHLRSRGRKDTDFLSPFRSIPSEFQSNVANWLLLRAQPPFPSGRVPLLFCPACGDIECGAVTVSVERTDGVFQWKDF